MDRKQFWGLVKTSFHEWQDDNVNLRAGALAFFIIVPLPPLLLFLTAVFVQFFGSNQAIPELIQEISVVAGPVVAGMFRDILESSVNSSFSLVAFVLSVVFSLLGALGALAVLHDIMNSIWDVKCVENQGIGPRLRHYVAPFLKVLPLFVLIIAWTGLTVVLFNFMGILLRPLTGDLTSLILDVGQVGVSFILAFLLFAVVFESVPDVEIQWMDVFLAAVITAVVFTVGNLLFGLFVRAFSATVIGVTGSLILLLLWIFLICQFMLFGAEFSRVYATTVGSLAQSEKQKQSQP